MPHRFEAARLERLDSPLRRVFMPPKRALKKLGLKEGDCFIDVGAGPGFFALPASELVGHTGEVFAVDIQAEAVAILERKRKELDRNNLYPVLSKENSLELRDGVGTFAFMYTVLHEVADKEAMLANLFRALAPGGRIAIIEFSEKALFGPSAEERIDAAELLRLLTRAGFDGAESGRWSAVHYVAKAKKPNAAEMHA